VARRLGRSDIEAHLTVKALGYGGTEPTFRSLGGRVWACLPRVAVYDDPDRPVIATLVVDLDERGRRGWSSVTLEARPGHLIVPGDERLPLGLITEVTVRWEASYLGPDLPAGAFAPIPPTGQRELALDYDAAMRQASSATSTRRSRQRVTSEVLQRVANTYRSPPEGKSRREAVADSENVGRSRANKLIQAARAAGFLRPAPGPRQSGEIEEPATTSRAKPRAKKRSSD
jgi:hypothetical protein